MFSFSSLYSYTKQSLRVLLIRKYSIFLTFSFIPLFALEGLHIKITVSLSLYRSGDGIDWIFTHNACSKFACAVTTTWFFLLLSPIQKESKAIFQWQTLILPCACFLSILRGKITRFQVQPISLNINMYLFVNFFWLSFKIVSICDIGLVIFFRPLGFSR